MKRVKIRTISYLFHRLFKLKNYQNVDVNCGHTSVHVRACKANSILGAEPSSRRRFRVHFSRRKLFAREHLERPILN